MSDRDTEQVRRSSQASQGIPADTAQGLSVGQIVGMVLKHTRFIAVCTIICALVSLAYVLLATPIYEATATLRIDQSTAGSLGLNDLVPGSVSTTDVVPTEIEVLQSDRVVIATLDSLPDDAFKRFSGGEKKDLFIPAKAEDLTPEQEDIIAQFKEQLEVKQVAETQLVGIGFRDPDPKLAAVIANHLVAAYLRENFDSRHQSVSQVATWLSSQLQDLKTHAAEAQRKLSEFEEKNGILASEGVGNPGQGTSATTTTDRLRQLNERLAGAEADRIVKEAQYRTATTGDQDPSVLVQVFPNAKLQALQATQATLSAQYEQLTTKFGPNYTPVVQLKAQLADLSAEIVRSAALIRLQVKKEYEASKQTEDMLRQEYENQTQRAYSMNRQEAELSALRAEGTASRELYNTLQYKLQQAGVDAGLIGVNTIPVDLARTAQLPVAPKKKAILALGTALGLLIGITAALVIESSADKLMSFEQLRGVVRLVPLVTIPRDAKNRRRTAGEGPVTLTQPSSRTADMYRRLRTLVVQGIADQNTKSYLITSTHSGEGKTSVALNYAVVLAQTGASVLLVDAELSRPTVAQALSMEGAAGLGEAYEAGGRPEPIQPIQELPTLSVLSSGKTLPFSAEVLASERFHGWMTEWRQQFDYVVIKAAPVLSVSDSLPLANWADAVLLVARQGVTRVSHLKLTQDVLNQAGANVLGLVISDGTAVSDTQRAEQAYGKGAYV